MHDNLDLLQWIHTKFVLYFCELYFIFYEFSKFEKWTSTKSGKSLTMLDWPSAAAQLQQARSALAAVPLH
jgi:hypothetical protein